MLVRSEADLSVKVNQLQGVVAQCCCTIAAARSIAWGLLSILPSLSASILG